MTHDGTEVWAKPHQRPEPLAEPDHRELLLKYIEHVGRSTGLTHLETHQRGTRSQETAFKDTTVFRDDEWEYMRQLSEDRSHRQLHIPVQKAAP